MLPTAKRDTCRDRSQVLKGELTPPLIFQTILKNNSEKGKAVSFGVTAFPLAFIFYTNRSICAQYHLQA